MLNSSGLCVMTDILKENFSNSNISKMSIPRRGIDVQITNLIFFLSKNTYLSNNSGFIEFIWYLVWIRLYASYEKWIRLQKLWNKKVVRIRNSKYLQFRTWFSVSMRALREFWNCAVTVSGCLRVFTVDWLDKFWPAVSVFTVCKFFNPFFGLSRGRNDLFFLWRHNNTLVIR